LCCAVDVSGVYRTYSGICASVSSELVLVYLKIDSVFFFERLVFVVGILIYLVCGVREVMVSVKFYFLGSRTAYVKAERGGIAVC
jgi:hypothetical protein